VLRFSKKSQKKLAKKWRYWLKQKVIFEEKVNITLVFEKNAIFFAENWQKSLKIVIITSVLGVRCREYKVWRLFTGGKTVDFIEKLYWDIFVQKLQCFESNVWNIYNNHNKLQCFDQKCQFLNKNINKNQSIGLKWGCLKTINWAFVIWKFSLVNVMK
jgi:hypothetical protein